MPFDNSDLDPWVDTAYLSGYPNFQKETISAKEWLDLCEDIDIVVDIVESRSFREYWKAKRLAERSSFEKFLFLNQDKWSREIATFLRLANGLVGRDGRLVNFEVGYGSTSASDKVYIPGNALKEADKWFLIVSEYRSKQSVLEQFRVSERGLTDTLH